MFANRGLLNMLLLVWSFCSIPISAYGLGSYFEFCEKYVPIGVLCSIPDNILYANYSHARIPAYNFNYGRTELKIHYLNNYADIQYSNVRLQISEVFKTEDDEYESIVIDDTVVFVVQIAGSSIVQIMSDFHKPVIFYIDPCCSNEIWIDLMSMEFGEQYLFTSGRLDALNRAMSRFDRYKFNIYESDKYYIETNIVEFKDSVESELDRFSKFLTNSPMPSLYKELYEELFKGYLLAALIDYDIYRYFYTGEMKKSKNCFSILDEFSSKVDWNSSLLLLTAGGIGKRYAMCRYNFLRKNIMSGDIKLYFELDRYYQLYEKYNNNLSSISETEINSLGTKFYNIYKFYEKLHHFVKATEYDVGYNINMGGNFNDIFKKTKGDYSIILFWGVNCGACELEVDEIRKLEPLNDTKVIYITTPYWSPYKRWRNQIKEMNGEHYYVSQADWDRMLAQYNTKGIPLTLFVNPSGDVVPKYGYMTSEQIMDEINKFRH